ncbi:iron donor protein CyaY [Vibrio sp. JC009]|uniref:iron donor protein CyaY n=1 Tax=Vibrio sp. JC009 TaxID=2912314 RepID=UPI0023B11C1E|nr:iron donor protein CyaY [Vibrio sp. JC009]WED21771.1 iron donor protein CyaY [Vibrio sp. JC009]
MNATEYHELADEEFNRIEEAIDESGADIDYETVGNVLTLEFDDRSQIVINKQEPMQEIWLASKSGGFHFSFNGEQWICSKTGIEFFAMVKEECEKYSAEEIEWS